MKRLILTVAGCVGLLGLSSCDNRNTQEKLYAPNPDYATRYVMACPECGAPQKPYRINELTAYYKCTGLPPKFVYHPERKWDHHLSENEQ